MRPSVNHSKASSRPRRVSAFAAGRSTTSLRAEISRHIGSAVKSGSRRRQLLIGSSAIRPDLWTASNENRSGPEGHQSCAVMGTVAATPRVAVDWRGIGAVTLLDAGVTRDQRGVVRVPYRYPDGTTAKTKV